MKLYERFGESGFHSAFLSTYCIDFEAFETIALRRLRGSGVHNTTVLCDAGMLNEALSIRGAEGSVAGMRYSLMPAEAEGVFHPKIFLQVGQRKARVIVGSANLTASGLAGNLEIVCAVECEGADDPRAPIVSAIWRYLRERLDRRQEAARRSIAWLEDRSRWLVDIVPATTPIALEDGNQCGFFHEQNERSIAAQFVDAIGGEPIERLVVVSPYWDADLGALAALRAELGGVPAITVVVDTEAGLFPGEVAAGIDRLEVRKVVSLERGKADKRFAHAKLFVAIGKTREHVLSGSANCTRAGIGTPARPGRNGEACLYHNVQRGAVTGALGIDVLLRDEEAVVATSDIRPLQAVEEDREGVSSGSSAGVFEANFAEVVWLPPADVPHGNAGVSFYSECGELLENPTEVMVSPAGVASGITIDLPQTGRRPRLARVTFADGRTSRLVIVADTTILRRELRDPRSRKVDQILSGLSTESEVTHHFLEMLTELEREEAKHVTDRDTGLASGEGYVPRAGNSSSEEGQTEEVGEDRGSGLVRRLSYQEFIANRRLRHDDDGLRRDGLSGSYVTSLRNILNRIVGGALCTDDEEDEDLTDKEDFDFRLGDETASGAEALEGGLEVDDAEMPERQPEQRDVGSDEAPHDEEVVRRRSRRRADARFCEKLVNDALDRFAGGELGAQPLTENDIFRLRLLLTVLAAVGFSGTLHKSGSPLDLSLQKVLPSGPPQEMGTWPRLMARLLHMLASRLKSDGGNGLQIDASFDRLSDNVLETWGACYWCMQACRSVVTAKYDERLAAIFAKLEEDLYEAIGLSRDDACHPVITQSFDGLTRRYARALELDEPRIRAAHQATANLRISPSSRLPRREDDMAEAR